MIEMLHFYNGLSAVIMIGVGWLDYKKHIIPLVVTIPALFFALLYQGFFLDNIIGALQGLAAGAVVSLLMVTGRLLIYKNIDVGGGDVWLFLVLGALIGWPLIIPVYIIGTFFMSLITLILWINLKYIKRQGKRFIKLSFPVAPYYCFIALAWFVSSSIVLILY